VFESARRIALNFDDEGIFPIGSGPNEEPCFALAMAEQGLAPAPGRGRWIVHLPDPTFVEKHVDFSRRIARIEFEGIEQDCAILHFAAFRTQPIYYREKFRVDYGWAGSPISDVCAAASAYAHSFLERARKRILRRGAPPSTTMQPNGFGRESA
jgi:hypothetical protein